MNGVRFGWCGVRLLSSKSIAIERSPWWYVPTLYFQQGLPVILVQQFSVLMYKKLGVPNDEIGLWTSLITWPWILKMFWGPLVDSHSTKRKWVEITQILITIFLGLAALAVTSSHFLPLTLAIFFIMAFFSATHDNALDAFYMEALPPTKQAFFIGIRSTFFRLAMVFCTGGLVVLAGSLETHGFEIARAWQFSVLAAAVLYGILTVYARWAAPVVTPIVKNRGEASFQEAFRTFFIQRRVWAILLFFLTYRFGESMLSKMSGLFLLDTRPAGGLGLTTLEVGVIVGNFGMIALVAGGILGGITVSKFGLKKCIWPMAFTMHIPNLLYLWAANSLPPTSTVGWIVAVDQFAYGFGLASYMFFAMEVCRKSFYKASHYAMIAGVMALGAMLAGMASGFVQKTLGYPGFFTVVCLATVPGMLLIFFLPLEEKVERTWN
jgi:PAT family beta-lactamase induction signal transducer AmpG